MNTDENMLLVRPVYEMCLKINSKEYKILSCYKKKHKKHCYNSQKVSLLPLPVIHVVTVQVIYTYT